MKIPAVICCNVKMLMHKAYKHRADITFFGGMALTMVGTGLFVKATNEIQPVLEAHRDLMAGADSTEDYAKAEEEKENKDHAKQLYAEAKKARKDITRKTTKELVKTYAAPVAVSVVGYGLELYSHKELKSDLATASIALNSVTAAYEALKTKMGDQAVSDARFEERVSNDGETTTSIDLIDDPHTMWFGSDNPNFSKSRDGSRAFIMQMFNTFDWQMHNRDWVLFESDVRKALGEKDDLNLSFKRQHPYAGWVLNKTAPLDFGLYSNDERTKAFMDGTEPSVWLRFNAVENVYDYI